MGIKMAWSDYINTKSLKLTEAQTGMEALMLAIDERGAPFGVAPIAIKKLQNIHAAYYNSLGIRDTIMGHIDTAMNNLCGVYYLKPSVATDLNSIEFDYEVNGYGLCEAHYNNTWGNIANVCEYLGEEEIKWFAPLNKKFPAAWFEQRIRIINLLTVARYSPSVPFGKPHYPCNITAEYERKSRSHRNEYYDEHTFEELLSTAINSAENSSPSPGYYCSIESYCKKTYAFNRKYASASSTRTKFGNANSVISQAYDIIIIAKPAIIIVDFPDLPPVYDAGNSGFIENEQFTLIRYRAENGVAEQTDWFGYSNFYPQPVPNPAYEKTNIRGYKLYCLAVIDFAVPGGFEFIEEI